MVVAWLFLLIAASVTNACVEPADCSVNTSSGTLNGNCTESYRSFFGVPYAQAPVQSLRFKPPSAFRVNYDTGNGANVSIDATKKPPACPQNFSSTYGAETNEDCLYLNVFAPPVESHSKYPVMVWIHGGSFNSGYAAEEQLDGSLLASGKDIIVVSLNYRLGALGWFGGENHGMLDAIQAIKWVRENIAEFGGDPSQITIAGQSSGGTMIRYLLNCSKAVGLFQRAIIQSDPAGFGAFNKSEAIGASDDLAKALNCTNSSDMNCLQHVSVSNIVSKQSEFGANSNSLQYGWGPTVDGGLIPQDTFDAVRSGKLSVNPDTEVMIGTVEDEVAASLDTIDPDSPQEVVNLAIKKVLPELAPYYTGTWRKKLDTESTPFESLVDLGTDYEFLCPSWTSFDAIVQKRLLSKVYFYKFKLGIHNPHSETMFCQPRKPQHVCHEDDILPLFGQYSGDITDEQKQLITEVQARWTQFVKSGDPNIDGDSNDKVHGVRWNPASSNFKNVLLIGSNKVSQTEEVERCSSIDNNLAYMFEQ